MLWLLIFGTVLLLMGWLSLSRARTLHHTSGLPVGRLVYADVDSADWHVNNSPLYSATHHLTGKPDYLVQTKQGLIPVEVKSARAPAVPYLGHILQVAAYCLLVEEKTGQAPPHGLIKYADGLFEVDFSESLRQELLNTMAEMRRGYGQETVHRNHDQPNRCRACGFFEVCEEALGE